MAELPPPMQVGDFYLAALLDEIKGLRADLDAARAPVVVNNGPTELREPKPLPDSTDASSEPPAKSLLQRMTRR